MVTKDRWMELQNTPGHQVHRRLAFLRRRRGLLDCEASPDPAGRMMTDSLVAGGPPMRAIPCPSNAHPAAEKAARAARPKKHLTVSTFVLKTGS